MGNVLVFDVGATHTRLALASGGELQRVVRVDTDPRPTGFATFLGLLEELAKGHNVEAVAGGIAGQFEGDDGHLTLVPNLPDWEGIPVKQSLSKLFDCPTYILNDVVVGGLGECHYGAGSPRGVMAYFTISTGINAVRIVDGVVDASIERFEIGRHILEEHDGAVASLESLVGGAALEKRLGKAPREVRDAAVWDEEEEHLAYGLYNVLIDWTPELVVFGGSMMRDINLDDVCRNLGKLPKVLSEWPQLRQAKLGDTAGLLGSLKYLEQLGV
jgi:fructokinase